MKIRKRSNRRKKKEKNVDSSSALGIGIRNLWDFGQYSNPSMKPQSKSTEYFSHVIACKSILDLNIGSTLTDSSISAFLIGYQ